MLTILSPRHERARAQSREERSRRADEMTAWLAKLRPWDTFGCFYWRDATFAAAGARSRFSRWCATAEARLGRPLRVVAAAVCRIGVEPKVMAVMAAEGGPLTAKERSALRSLWLSGHGPADLRPVRNVTRDTAYIAWALPEQAEAIFYGLGI